MQNFEIKTAGELKTLALAVSPEEYAEKLRTCVVDLSAVEESVNILLDNEDMVSYHIGNHIANNASQQNEIVMQVMQGYHDRSHDNESFSDRLQATIYNGLKKDIDQLENTIAICDDQRCSRQCNALSGVMVFSTAAMALIEVALYLFLINTCSH